VIARAELEPREVQRRLAEHRSATKDFACDAVKGYMSALNITLDDLTDHAAARASAQARMGARALALAVTCNSQKELLTS
jgi:hypothetical protein